MMNKHPAYDDDLLSNIEQKNATISRSAKNELNSVSLPPYTKCICLIKQRS
jgi:hypothetical protein